VSLVEREAGVCRIKTGGLRAESVGGGGQISGCLECEGGFQVEVGGRRRCRTRVSVRLRSGEETE